MGKHFSPCPIVSFLRLANSIAQDGNQNWEVEKAQERKNLMKDAKEKQKITDEIDTVDNDDNLKETNIIK